MEEVRIATDGRAEVGVCAGFPFVLEVGAVDGFETHVGHAAGHLKRELVSRSMPAISVHHIYLQRRSRWRAQ